MDRRVHWIGSRYSYEAMFWSDELDFKREGDESTIIKRSLRRRAGGKGSPGQVHIDCEELFSILIRPHGFSQ